MRLDLLRLIAVCIQVASLISAATMPPGFYHAHAGGNAPHDHASAAEEHHHRHDGHPHHSQRHVDHHHSAPVVSQGIAGHVHFTWFGLPISEPADNQSEQSSLSQNAVAVQKVTVTDALATPAGQLVVLVALPSTASPIHFVCTLHEAPVDKFHVDRVFLSDTARHERSGVQLI